MARYLSGSATRLTSSFPNLSCSSARDSSALSCVVHVVSEALRSEASQYARPRTGDHGDAHLSRDPGVMTGVSPTLSAADRLTFLSKYFFASALSFVAYSFSIALRSL